MDDYDTIYRQWLDQWDNYLSDVLYALTVGFPVRWLAQPRKTPPTRASVRPQTRVRSASHVKGWQTRRANS